MTRKHAPDYRLRIISLAAPTLIASVISARARNAERARQWQNTGETLSAIPRCDRGDVLGTIIAKLNLYPMILTLATPRARHYRERLDKSSTYRGIKTSASSRIAKKLAVVEIDKEASGAELFARRI